MIDTRKSFEYDVGTFKKSLNPNVENFRQFPKYLNQFKKSENIAMFCTGGIRCEKANIYLKKKGFKNVYVLKGGIINYLNNIDRTRIYFSTRQPKQTKERKEKCLIMLFIVLIDQAPSPNQAQYRSQLQSQI